jgi:tRNA nucleotidyltransferase (CCA-adding enzyme)
MGARPADPRLESVAPTERALLERAAAAADRLAIRAAWVGGGVRDLLLGRPHPDLDLTAEGDWEALVAALARDLGARAVLHAEFRTATLELPDGRRIDLAGARAERYPWPAALPEVSPASLEVDLARRDFAVNAMALLLSPASDRGSLLDPQRGRDDVAARRLRILHPRSFVDDPTRILRGVRFELRLDFRLEDATETAARSLLSAGGLDPLSGTRLADALERLFREPAPLARLLERLADLGVLAAVAPGLDAPRRVTEVERAAARLATDSAVDPWRLALAAWTAGAPQESRRRLADRLALPGAQRRLIVAEVTAARAAAAELESDALAPATVADRLAPLSMEALALVAASGERAASWVRRFVDGLRGFSLVIGAGELLAAGARPGPAIGEALRATRAARLDGALSAAGELEFALARYREAAGR